MSILGVELSNAFSITARARYTFEVDNQPQKSTWVRLLKRAVAKAEDAEVSECWAMLVGEGTWITRVECRIRWTKARLT